MLLGPLDYLGRAVIGWVDSWGQFTRFLGQVFSWLFSGVRIWIRPRLLVPLLFQIGTRSLPVVMLVGGFVGMVLSVEAYDQFAAIGQETRLGGVINISVLKQIGPVLTAVMIAGRVGGSISAQLGTMAVTEQLDAMRVMGTDPMVYLVAPRVVACVLMVPLLTLYSDIVGIFGGYAVTVWGYGVNGPAYWDFSAQFIGTYDVCVGLIKTVIFGLMIGLISCYKGFRCEAGAAGVGRAATDAFVSSFMAIIMLNFFLAKFLKDLYYMLFGYGGPTAFGG